MATEMTRERRETPESVLESCQVHAREYFMSMLVKQTTTTCARKTDAAVISNVSFCHNVPYMRNKNMALI